MQFYCYTLLLLLAMVDSVLMKTPVMDKIVEGLKSERETLRNPKDLGWKFTNWIEICMKSKKGTLVRNKNIKVSSRKNKLPKPEQCGIKPNDINDNHIKQRISGGKEPMPHEWPWLVAIGLRESGQSCGGVLIGQRWVVTAAHCLVHSHNPCDYVVRVGEHHLANPEEEHIDIIPSRIIVHPSSTFVEDGDYFADIALIQLSFPAKSKDSKEDYACLPVKTLPLQSGSKCYVSGWGMISFNPPLLPNTPRHIKVRSFSDRFCKSVWSDDMPGIICAGDLSGRSDTCDGDSGGPLMCRDEKGHYRLYGVLSFGHSSCGNTGIPSVFSDIQYYRSWIKSTTNKVKDMDKGKNKS